MIVFMGLEGVQPLPQETAPPPQIKEVRREAMRPVMKRMIRQEAIIINGQANNIEEDKRKASDEIATLHNLSLVSNMNFRTESSPNGKDVTEDGKSQFTVKVGEEDRGVLSIVSADDEGFECVVEGGEQNEDGTPKTVKIGRQELVDSYFRAKADLVAGYFPEGSAQRKLVEMYASSLQDGEASPLIQDEEAVNNTLAEVSSGLEPEEPQAEADKPKTAEQQLNAKADQIIKDARPELEDRLNRLKAEHKDTQLLDGFSLLSNLAEGAEGDLAILARLNALVGVRNLHLLTDENVSELDTLITVMRASSAMNRALEVMKDQLTINRYPPGVVENFIAAARSGGLTAEMVAQLTGGDQEAFERLILGHELSAEQNAQFEEYCNKYLKDKKGAGLLYVLLVLGYTIGKDLMPVGSK